MKKMILCTVLIGGYFTQVFSQVTRHIKMDTTLRNFSIDNYQKPYSLGNSIDFTSQFKGPLSDKSFLFKSSFNRKLNMGQNSMASFERRQCYDRMPCIKPQGFFPMRTWKPDSTVSYALRIEK